MSRKFFGLLALSGMVLMIAGFSTQSKEAKAGFLFFGHDDDDCCTPAPKCCAPAPTCCKPAPTCCGSAPAYEGGHDHGTEGAAPTPPAEPAPAPAAAAAEKTDA
jgi:hypothetical protein